MATELQVHIERILREYPDRMGASPQISELNHSQLHRTMPTDPLDGRNVPSEVSLFPVGISETNTLGNLEGRMTFGVGSRAAAFILVVLSVANAVGQKVKVGYDKSVNFSSYASYTWGEPSAPPTRPILYASVVAWTERILASKGFSSIEKDGDLILVPAGAMEFGLNSKAGTPIIPSYGAQPAAIDGTMWTGASGSKGSAPYVPEGALMLTFVDRKTNRIIWSGTVTQKLDLEKKEKSLKLAERAVIKLLAKFPPPRRD